MAASVVEDTDFALCCSRVEQGLASDRAAAVVAGVLHLGLVAQVEPAAAEYALPLHLHDFRRRQCGAVVPEDTLLSVVDNQVLYVHAALSRQGMGTRNAFRFGGPLR